MEMDKEKVEDVKAFLNGELSLNEILEIEGKSLWDYDLDVAGNLLVTSEPKNDDYEFELSIEDKDFGVSESELMPHIESMRERGFKDFGTVGGVVADEILTCPECEAEYVCSKMDYDEWQRLYDNRFCPKCRVYLESERVYEHVHLEGSKTVKISKREIEGFIKASKSIQEFAGKLLKKLELWYGW